MDDAAPGLAFHKMEESFLQFWSDVVPYLIASGPNCSTAVREDIGKESERHTTWVQSQKLCDVLIAQYITLNVETKALNPGGFFSKYAFQRVFYLFKRCNVPALKKEDIA